MLIPTLPRLSPLLVLSLSLLLSARARAVGSGDASLEYQEVRKIALRDPRVREGFERANERLEQKILELDPALRGYVARHPERPPEAAAAVVKEPFQVHHTSKAATAPRPSPSTAHSGSHVVSAGETVDSIARRYGVSPAALERTNHITDPRKLRVGQMLSIPATSKAASPVTPAAATDAEPSESHPAAATSTPPANSPGDPQPDGLWDKLKRSF